MKEFNMKRKINHSNETKRSKKQFIEKDFFKICFREKRIFEFVFDNVEFYKDAYVITDKDLNILKEKMKSQKFYSKSPKHIINKIVYNFLSKSVLINYFSFNNIEHIEYFVEQCIGKRDDSDRELFKILVDNFYYAKEVNNIITPKYSPFKNDFSPLQKEILKHLSINSIYYKFYINRISKINDTKQIRSLIKNSIDVFSKTTRYTIFNLPKGEPKMDIIISLIKNIYMCSDNYKTMEESSVFYSINFYSDYVNNKHKNVYLDINNDYSLRFCEKTFPHNLLYDILYTKDENVDCDENLFRIDNNNFLIITDKPSNWIGKLNSTDMFNNCIVVINSIKKFLDVDFLLKLRYFYIVIITKEVFKIVLLFYSLWQNINNDKEGINKNKKWMYNQNAIIMDKSMRFVEPMEFKSYVMNDFFQNLKKRFFLTIVDNSCNNILYNNSLKEDISTICTNFFSFSSTNVIITTNRHELEKKFSFYVSNMGFVNYNYIIKYLPAIKIKKSIETTKNIYSNIMFPFHFNKCFVHKLDEVSSLFAAINKKLLYKDLKDKYLNIIKMFYDSFYDNNTFEKFLSLFKYYSIYVNDIKSDERNFNSLYHSQCENFCNIADLLKCVSNLYELNDKTLPNECKCLCSFKRNLKELNMLENRMEKIFNMYQNEKCFKCTVCLNLCNTDKDMFLICNTCTSIICFSCYENPYNQNNNQNLDKCFVCKNYYFQKNINLKDEICINEILNVLDKTSQEKTIILFDENRMDEFLIENDEENEKALNAISNINYLNDNTYNFFKEETKNLNVVKFSIINDIKYDLGFVENIVLLNVPKYDYTNNFLKFLLRAKNFKNIYIFDDFQKFSFLNNFYIIEKNFISLV